MAKVHKTKLTVGKAIKAVRAAHPDVVFDTTEVEGGFQINANVGPDTPEATLASLATHDVNIIQHAEAPPVPDATAPATEAKPPKEKKPKMRWRDRWVFAPGLVDKKVAAGQPPFKEGTKRDITLKLLTKTDEAGNVIGCTIQEGIDGLGTFGNKWDATTVKSSFTEIAYLLHRKVKSTKTGDVTRYTMETVTDEMAAERKAQREARKVEIAAEKARKAKAKADKEAAQAIIAQAQAAAGQGAAAAPAE
jgi:hypothetical protein